jgi:hypothetical protein
MATAAEKLAALALAVSTDAPMRLKGPGHMCYVSKELIQRIRDACNESQIDWRQLHKNARIRGGS